MQSRKRHRPGTRALQEIRRCQKTVKALTPKKSFQRDVREVLMDLYPEQEFRFSLDSLEALSEACEAFIVKVFEDACTCSIHGKRITVMPSDVHLVRRLQRW